jgi:hypothetical protein
MAKSYHSASTSGARIHRKPLCTAGTRIAQKFAATGQLVYEDRLLNLEILKTSDR